MAKAKLNPILLELHGKVGDMVFRRTRNGGVSLIRKADMSKVKWSPAQVANRQRFREALAYAKQLLADPQVRATYDEIAAKQGKRALEVAVAKYLQNKSEYADPLHPPSDRAEDTSDDGCGSAVNVVYLS